MASQQHMSAKASFASNPLIYPLKWRPNSQAIQANELHHYVVPSMRRAENMTPFVRLGTLLRRFAHRQQLVLAKKRIYFSLFVPQFNSIYTKGRRAEKFFHYCIVIIQYFDQFHWEYLAPRPVLQIEGYQPGLPGWTTFKIKQFNVHLIYPPNTDGSSMLLSPPFHWI